MHPEETSSNSQNQDVEGDAFQHLEGAAQFWSSVAKLTSLLDSSERQGRSLGDATRTWHKWERDALSRQYEHVVNARLAWWHYLLNPFWSIFFVLKQREAVKDPASVQNEKWELLDYYLGRAEFMFSLSKESRTFLREKIADGAISRRRAMALVRSFGCFISKSGDISASPIGAVGLAIGVSIMSTCVALFVLFLCLLVAELLGDCARACVVSGSIQLMVMAIYFTMLLRALSTGRNRDAQLLSKLQFPVVSETEVLQ